MATYAALISLKNTITCLIDSRHLSVPHSEYEIMRGASLEIESLQHVIEILDRPHSSIQTGFERVDAWDLVGTHLSKMFPAEYPVVRFAFKDTDSLCEFMWWTRVDSSDGRIIEAVSSLEDVLESLVLLGSFGIEELDRAKQGIDSFKETVKRLNDDGNNAEEMVRLWDEYLILRELLAEIMKYAERMLSKLESVVRRLGISRSNCSRERLNVLETQIREAVYDLEDLLETRLSDQFLISQSDSESLVDGNHPLPFPMDLNEVEKHFHPFCQSVVKLKHEYMHELINLEQDNENIISSRKSSGKNKSKMVGSYDKVRNIKYELTGSWSSNLEMITLFGMAGIGKTTVAKQAFEDPSVLERFELRAWVDIGQNNQLKRIKQSVLAQVSPHNIDEILAEGDESLDKYLHESLNERRYLVVLDDVWDTSVWEDLKLLFPDDSKGSRVLLTTRLRKVAECNNMHEMCFMGEKESWDLLRERVFGEASYPLLENAGKKIAESCEGLPLTIITVGKLLSKVKKTPEKWNELAANPNSLLEDAYDRMLKVLLPSYNYLPQHLKAAFLYMGVFPRNYKISHSELTKLWVAEKLLGLKMQSTLVYLISKELFEDTLLIAHRRRSSSGIKTWSVHSSFWHLCKTEARKNKFSHVMKCFGDSLSEGIKDQRRLCVHNNTLFGIKDVYKSMASISTARSLLCTGPPHQYPVPICFSLRLLRVVNALTVRLYEFPMEVLKLVQLKYLSLTCYGDLPSSISKLQNLQFLIIRRHQSVSSSGAPSYLPIEIWEMKELMHLQIMGSDLPNPYDDASLPNLLTLLDVSARSCTKGVFEGTPNLKKLGIRIEVAPDAFESTCCFDHISHLKKLESLKCVVANPTFNSDIDIAPPRLPAVLPSSLEKLSLSGLKYPWDEMRVIASLPNLNVLKLECYAFQGPKWEIEGNGFPKLSYLRVEDTDLVNWTVERGSLPELDYVLFRSCYMLGKISLVDSRPISRPVIELINCNPLATTCAQQLEGYMMHLNLHSSRDDCLDPTPF